MKADLLMFVYMQAIQVKTMVACVEVHLCALLLVPVLLQIFHIYNHVSI